LREVVVANTFALNAISAGFHSAFRSTRWCAQYRRFDAGGEAKRSYKVHPEIIATLPYAPAMHGKLAMSMLRVAIRRRV
jgi:hypothetical protein